MTGEEENFSQATEKNLFWKNIPTKKEETPTCVTYSETLI